MFEGERVRLRGIQEADIDALARMEAQADIVALRRAGPPFPGGRAEAEAFYGRSKTDLPTVHHFAIEAVEDGRFVGRCSLHNTSQTHRSAELGIGLLAEELGAGLGGEALQLLLEYAFVGVLLHRVYLQVRADNAAAIAAFRRAGLQEEARYREEAYDDRGRRVDVLSMSMLEDEWPGGER